MVCKNCGAEIDDNLNNCPYCGTENHKKAEETHRNVMNAYDVALKEGYKFGTYGDAMLII